MLAILEDGPGCGTKAGFLPPQLVAEALNAAQGDDELFTRHPLLVVPQAALGSLRADVLVMTRSRLGRSHWHGRAAHAFLVECDSLEFHAGRVQEDLARERAIRRTTGLDFLRFSGAEINFRPHQVHQVLAARVEAMHALHEFGDAIQSYATRVIEHVGAVSCHPALRTEYQARNSPEEADLYDSFDPQGEHYNSPPDIDCDPFEAMRDAVARLRHRISYLRLAGPGWEPGDTFPERTPRSLGTVLAGIMARMTKT
jgi:hypothetical protein